VAQHAALAAFDPATRFQLEARKSELRQRRDLLLPELRRLGFGVPIEPDGAFYIYADVSAIADDSERFSETLLEQAGVAVTPGVDFGSHHAGKYLRFAYTTNEIRIREAISRLAPLLGK
jgi:aspartate/methionine/tyrosine aminotransferase